MRSMFRASVNGLRAWRSCMRDLLRVTFAIAAIGCANDAVVSPNPTTDPGDRLWSLTLDHHAVTLSTAPNFDTVQLTATPRTVTGAPLTGLPTATFTSLDQDRIQVDSTGLVHAIGAGDLIPVIASLRQGDVTRTDTVMFNVTSEATPPVVSGFSIHPVDGDSAKIALYNAKAITARVTDADGVDIPDVAVYYTTLDRTTAQIDPISGLLFPVRPGRVTLIASATVYGVSKADTLEYIIGFPIFVQVNITPRTTTSGDVVNAFDPASLTVGPGARVFFFTSSPNKTDVTFDDPTNVAQDDEDCEFIPFLCGTGNIEPFAIDPGDPDNPVTARARRFPVPGTYSYHSTIFGTTGTIVVVNDGATP
jgi:plastocyanin